MQDTMDIEGYEPKSRFNYNFNSTRKMYDQLKGNSSNSNDSIRSIKLEGRRKGFCKSI